MFNPDDQENLKLAQDIEKKLEINRKKINKIEYKIRKLEAEKHKIKNEIFSDINERIPFGFTLHQSNYINRHLYSLTLLNYDPGQDKYVGVFIFNFDTKTETNRVIICNDDEVINVDFSGNVYYRILPTDFTVTLNHRKTGETTDYLPMFDDDKFPFEFRKSGVMGIVNYDELISSWVRLESEYYIKSSIFDQVKSLIQEEIREYVDTSYNCTWEELMIPDRSDLNSLIIVGAFCNVMTKKPFLEYREFYQDYYQYIGAVKVGDRFIVCSHPENFKDFVINGKIVDGFIVLDFYINSYKELQDLVKDHLDNIQIHSNLTDISSFNKFFELIKTDLN